MPMPGQTNPFDTYQILRPRVFMFNTRDGLQLLVVTIRSYKTTIH